MDWQDQAKPTRDTKFSSCRGVSFELKLSPGSSFPFEAANRPVHQPPPDAPIAGRWIWFPEPFSSGSSRIFPAAGESHAFGRTQSRRSSHFCDLDDEEADHESVAIVDGADEETAVVTAAGAVDDRLGKTPCAPAPAKLVSSRRSRLGVILLDQGLFTLYKRLFVLCAALKFERGGACARGDRTLPLRQGTRSRLRHGQHPGAHTVPLFGRPWVPVIVKTGVTTILQSLGGVHSGCGVSSLAWLVYALVQALKQRDVTPREVVDVASAILGLLVLSCMAAFPLVRHLHHNVFERTHRFAGWSALALLWVFVVLTAGYDPETASYDRLTASILVKRQELWLSAAITFFTFLPWLTVRRVPVTVTARSNHASVITFQGGVKGGLLGRISRSPLSEWHAFGIISDNEETHAMLAGAVGDFTRALISDPPTRLWVRGVHFAGLPYLLNMYRRATMVATGSGICVFMSFLMQPGPAELSLVWVAKGIEANYGDEMKAAACSSERLRGRVIVHDTAVMGRPNVAALTVDAARRWGSEVVVVTSNPEGSMDVVRGCKKAGIAAFGPIWDS
ncbi:hypothetical protein BAE44_0002429 [Dichanthelium oligosanthes]|uniref:Adenylate-forming reductase n=1 Tax=Dichanthelium oligosanthes TaxID=888268 RepID=A0A1E5WGN1_9POAL|nr:hypothetical protein BAE44_0002429 [Dichanthelium oligosanthes]